MQRSLSVLFTLLIFVPATSAQTRRFQVRHEHGIKSCRGELIFSEQGVEYVTSHQKDARKWDYLDIQQLALAGDKKIAVVTYEDRKLHFGKDKIFNFEVTEGQIGPELWSSLQHKLGKPLVSAVIPDVGQAKYNLPVKHQHKLGGCEGTLEVGEQYLIYRTSHASDSRIWHYTDLSSVGSTGPFQLRVTTMERTEGEIGAERSFIFDLKRRLDSDVYDFVWQKVNAAGISSR